MPEQSIPTGRVSRELTEPVRVATNQIEDACIDKDCIEDLTVTFPEEAQLILEQATSARARNAELLNVSIDVTPLAYNQGWYTAELTFYYRVMAEAVTGTARPTPIDGVAVFTKRVVLYGGEGRARVFTSEDPERSEADYYRPVTPLCVVEVVDPMILSSRTVEITESSTVTLSPEIPPRIAALFDGPLIPRAEGRQLLVTLGQFSTVRMERSAQLLIPAYAYSVPEKACTDDPGTPDEPCDLFARVEFPTDAFYPRQMTPQNTKSSK